MGALITIVLIIIGYIIVEKYLGGYGNCTVNGIPGSRCPTKPKSGR